MKGLDTSFVVSLLDGDRAARDLVKRLKDVELATTEANLLELAFVAARTPSHAKRRQEVLDRLRRKVTVLPIDSRGVDIARRHIERRPRGVPPLVLAALGAFESAGCDEVYTREDARGWGKWRFKVKRIGH